MGVGGLRKIWNFGFFLLQKCLLHLGYHHLNIIDAAYELDDGLVRWELDDDGIPSLEEMFIEDSR